MTEPNLDWHSSVKRYLERLGLAEYQAQKLAAKGKKFRYSPSEYHRELIDLLNKNDEQGFKGLKMLSGFASALGV